MEESKDMIMCGHCDQLVSRTTYKRHNRKRIINELSNSLAKKQPSDTDDSETEMEDKNTNNNDNLPMQQLEENSESDGIPEDMDNNREVDSDLSMENEDSSSDQNLNKNGLSSTDEEDVEEIWSNVLPNQITRDLESGPPPVPVNQGNRQRSVVEDLVFWLVYFLLVWQLSCHISDNGMAWLLRFLSTWLKVLGLQIPHNVITQIVIAFPASMYMLRKILMADRDDFNKYVVCQKCHKLYDYNECLTKVNGKEVAKVCTGSLRKRGKTVQCGAKLLYRVQLSNGKSCHYPIKYYCFNSIINSLESLLQKQGFADKCEHWRERHIGNDLMADVYDGSLWHEFMTVEGRDFLKEHRNYGLMLNFDFFQPMKRRKDYSVGVFYLVILNLPRAERFKWENVLVVGIVPSMDKEPKNLNPFLQPAVKELQCLWRGMRLKSAKCRFELTFRAALIATSSDVPASRKLGGFKSHSAKHGCSRCLKLFPCTFGNKPDYSGFDMENWPKRTNEQHRTAVNKIATFKTASRRDIFCTDNGVTHYSILLDLPYFDAIRCFTIDPMHNLFLGTAKKMFHLWINKNLLTNVNLKLVEEKIRAIDVPSSIGRLPVKISSNSGCYTAEQWKNWTLLYSLFCLKDILPVEDFKCWQTFVLACKYVCQVPISKADVEIFHGLFVKFCKEVERLYGKEMVTPNMHLHCHLKDVILEHGPTTSFWCFSFERYNGILGSVPTNKRSLEVQLMRRIKMDNFFNGKDLPTLFKEDFLPLCSENKAAKDNVWAEDLTWTCKIAIHTLATKAPIVEGAAWSEMTGISTSPNHRLCTLDYDDATFLLEVYRTLYPMYTITRDQMSMLIKKFGSVTIGGERYGSKMETRSIRSGHILASWAANCGIINKDTFSLTPGIVCYYFIHSVQVNSVNLEHAFACVKWYQPTDERNNIGNPVQLWSLHHQEPGCACFMPVQRIYSHFAVAKHSSDKIVVVPLIRVGLL